MGPKHMFDLNSGELFVVVFILAAVVSAPVWPAVGEWIALRIAGVERPTKATAAESDAGPNV
jgi:hypothetical protein